MPKAKIHRPIYEIAEEISRDWQKPSNYAKPYLEAMFQLNNIGDWYGYEDAQMIVLRFLSNAQTWRGEKARTVKKELNAMCGY